MFEFFAAQTPAFLAMALALAAMCYMIPTLVAIGRGHGSTAQIAVLNLLLGLTFVGWVGALIWSLSARRGRVTV